MLIALIREAECVGCAKCISACPVDAIIGALQWNHMVLQDGCIGCKLCIEPCPVDCIEMVEFQAVIPSLELKTQAKQRRAARKVREKAHSAKLMRGTPHTADIQAALARFKAKHEPKTDPAPL